MHGLQRLRGGFALGSLIVVFVSWHTLREAYADEPRRPNVAQQAGASSSPAASPMQDDAGLYDVQFLGNQNGWAVGDRGTIWRTNDGGQSWNIVPCPVQCTLRSVCFLTDRVGWVAGGGITPHTRQGFGVVLFTSDGGKSWKQRGDDSLPPLFYVRFFGMEQGVAVAEASTEHPTGVLTTGDGGKTWQSIVGKDHPGWRAAHFFAPDAGIAVGLRGSSSLVAEKRMLPTRLPESGLRAFADVAIQPDSTGWLVGDGGLVMQTDSGGLVWNDVPTPLPPDINDIFDFRTVAARGPKAWIAGSPGSVILHTQDSGQTWTVQRTGQTVPISSITFADDLNGFAVGALGSILKTEDGGSTWQTVRGAGRRVALLAMHPRAGRISFHLTASESAENGYRSVALLPARYDVDTARAEEGDLDMRLHDAVVSAGGATGIVGWRLPVALPDIEKNKNELIAEWRRRTDSDLTQALLGTFVCALRTWRPSVIVLDEPPDDDAVGSLLKDALLAAVDQAADQTRFVSQLQLAGLDAWQVQKVCLRLPAGSQGQFDLDPHEYLPRLGRTADEVAATAKSRMKVPLDRAAAQETYQVLVDHLNLPNSAAARNDVFTGLALAPGSDARRMLLLYDDSQGDARRKLAEKARHIQGYSDKFFNDPRHAAQMIAQLSFITEGMSNEQAALQLAHFAEEYRERSQWELYEATLVDLVSRYGDEPIALVSMRQLLHLWSGVEPVWQRVRKVQVNRREMKLDTHALVDRIDRAVEAALAGKPDQFNAEQELATDPLQFVDKPGTLQAGGHSQWSAGAIQNSNRQAMQLAKLIRRKSPRFYRTAEVQCAVAALLRNTGSSQLADNFYHRANRGLEDSSWSATAASELWLATPHGAPPKDMAICRPATSPPYLDGDLTDACWQEGDKISLTAAKDKGLKTESQTVTMLTYDARYLYFAASIPRHPKAQRDIALVEGRAHDADLSGFDRVNICLDLDRDYSTYYGFAIDQRGQTAESCWGDRSWDPTWHVATKCDDDKWSVEVAIPFEELAPSPPVRGSVWAVGIVRAIPAVGQQSWTATSSSEPQPETFGLIRFD